MRQRIRTVQATLRKIAAVPLREPRMARMLVECGIERVCLETPCGVVSRITGGYSKEQSTLPRVLAHVGILRISWPLTHLKGTVHLDPGAKDFIAEQEYAPESFNNWGRRRMSQFCPRFGRGRHENCPSRGLIWPTHWWNEINSRQACRPCMGSCSPIPGRGCFGAIPGDEIVVSPLPPIVETLTGQTQSPSPPGSTTVWTTVA